METTAKKNSSREQSGEQIELLRGGSVVSSLAGVFGLGLRETRLTVMLGYLIALAPGEFFKMFGFTGIPNSVALEIRHDWVDCRRSFLFLDEPRLVFNPPIKKEKLQEGKGWLSKRVFSFDAFFEAWGC